MTDLRAAGSRAVLIGTGCATGGSGAAGLAGVPAVAATVTDLATTLVDRCGMTAGNVRVVLDPALPFGVGEALAEETRRAEDALLIYFCGHGLVSLDGNLYLATAATDSRPGYLTHTAVAYAQVRDAVLESPARVKIVILDCCYSGRAFATLGDTAGPEATGLSRIHGGYVLTAAGANEAALAPPGDRHTAFGGALIRLLTEGDPDGPRELTLQHAYAHLREMLPARGFPRPRRLATEAADGFVLAINPAFRLTDADLGTEPAGTGGEDSCPYRGLAAFDTGDSAWFFGRADETRTLLDRVAKARPGDPPLTLVGPSGVGKSSLLRAGVAFGAAHAVEPRLPIVFTPGPRPLSALYEALADRGTGPILLVVDQLEEIFTECADRQERDSFVAALTAGPEGEGLLGDAVVLLGLRADFYRHCLTYSGLRRALETGQVLLGPLSGAELATAVQAPAAAAGLTLQAGLVQIVLQDVHDQAEALAADKGTELDLQQGEVLPLLSHALRETWERRQGSLLTVTGYANSGRVARAVETSAERVHDALDEPGRVVLRALALRLAAVQQGMAITRQLVARDTLVDDVAPDTRPVAEGILDALVASGLVVTDGDAVGLAHSAVLRAWPRLRTWLEDSRQSLLVRRRLATAAERWHDEHQRQRLLYRGTQLTVAAELAEQGDTPLPARSRAFLEASTARRRRSRRVSALAAAVLVVTSVVVYGIAVRGEGCPSGLQSSSSVTFGDECVGVTAGSYVFRPELAAVEHRIAEENARVESGGGPAVTVALMAPFPVGNGNSVFSLDSIRHQLEGAYAAQVAANRLTPEVRLVLANEGASEGAWEPVAGRLAGMTSGAAPLVGVIGMGVSSPETLQGVRALGGKGVPVVASLVTADDFDEEPLNLLRVRPPNAQLAAVIARYIRDRNFRGKAVLVGDTDSGNLYAQSLRQDLKDRVGPTVESMTVHGYVGSHGSRSATFPNVVRGFCDTRPELVFFTGSQGDLAGFLDTVAAFDCGPIEVVAVEPGDVLLDRDRRARLAAAGVAVTAFIPAGWAAPSGPAPENPARYQRYRDDFAEAGFDPAGAAAAEAVSTHDALMTLVTAVYATRPAGPASPAAVTAQLSNLHGPLSVPGAEEDLDFGPHGVPARKAVGIVRYADGKPPQTIDVAHTE
ncbi:hypothetical protein Amsp01_093220 [Amycolatopsis sp. NBRC 101858]|uniref:caspase, EACC1-associated type n=1 Tax=Amycolatopsis sp. NBRC 101858 TaxID=3032200 RepID=UPI0024A11354|nr:caspase family protein [Amycolatopsis sp. NBRC 101858]GLY43299.1 hypothetical protein Amsp01_093220 [Amycolatopsis sp. NBRC 101858]